MHEYFLHPGELIFSRRHMLVKTVLGSCVAVCLHDKVQRIGGMCHYLLPVAPTDEQRSTKYGDVAIRVLLSKFLGKAGSRKEDLLASVIGGAFVVFDEREIFFVGDRNVEVALRLLKEHGVYVLQMNTGGDYGRRVLFEPHTNRLVVEQIKGVTVDDLYNPEA
ncbi:chemotaxis protein CheD [Spirochaeta thermophila]|uniref:Probable chemoreceptor glutamine deamidase CheD n=1 Tax=Winmispira thermophila (strain ATCC 49972 / DSM 6192 / RI 19.B1) TaxID=665571 RepID=E0RU41_WINT6|nr:chemotaxis protein CheD [Spirochaeta thermophila]ADN01097.1 probable chemoreceptor glutamine deamidase CheD [Spirochaeta thermophila DSM 6192]